MFRSYLSYGIVLVLLTLISSVSAQETSLQADGASFDAFISADGRFVFFMSVAMNLPAPGERQPGDIFVYDRELEEVKQLIIPGNGPVYEGGAYLNQPSGSGQFVPFVSWIDVPEMGGGLYLLDRDTDAIIALNVSAEGVIGDSSYPYESLNRAITLSDDGRWVLFLSRATNILPDDPNEDGADLYLLDRENGALERVLSSVSNNFPEGALLRGLISADGRYIAFEHWDDGVNLYVPEDTNLERDVFLLDRETGEITLMSRSINGSSGNGYSRLTNMSSDTRFILIESSADDLISNDTNGIPDIFLYDRETEQMELVSIAEGGRQLTEPSLYADVTPDGRYVVFDTNDANVFDDLQGTGFRNLYRLDRETGELTLVSHNMDGDYANHWSFVPTISDDGRFVAFTSNASDLVPDDTIDISDVFLYDAETDEITRISVPNR